MKSGFVVLPRPAQRRQVHAAQPHRRPEARHRLRQAADDAHARRRRQELPRRQVVFVDTPGVHKPTHRMNVRMVDIALEAMREVDVLALVVDASVKPGPGDRYLLDLLKDVKTPAILVLNKVDLIAKPKLLPIIDHYQQAHPFAEIVPVSARRRHQRRRARAAVPAVPARRRAALSAGLPDRSDRAVLRRPRSSASRCCSSRTTSCRSRPRSSSTSSTSRATDGIVNLYCTILVERESQKPIVIGKGGVDDQADRHRGPRGAERFFEERVYLDLHVKVKSEWRDDERLLDEIGAAEPRSGRRLRMRHCTVRRKRSAGCARATLRSFVGLTDIHHGGAAQNRSRPRLGQATAAHWCDRQPAESAAEAASRRPRADLQRAPGKEREAAFSLLAERNGRLAMEAVSELGPEAGAALLATRSGRRDRQARPGDPVRRRRGPDRLPAGGTVGGGPRLDAARRSPASSRTCSSTPSRRPAAS